MEWMNLQAGTCQPTWKTLQNGRTPNDSTLFFGAPQLSYREPHKALRSFMNEGPAVYRVSRRRPMTQRIPSAPNRAA